MLSSSRPGSVHAPTRALAVASGIRDPHVSRQAGQKGLPARGSETVSASRRGSKETPGRLALVWAQSPGDALEQGFKNPPEAAKPRTWWHWTNGNITKEGISKDLDWMKRAGIGGMQLADVASGSGQTVEKKILFGSPEWLDAVRHAASEADRLGLEMTIFSSAGWSETGGPWVKPEQAMKKLVWSETAVDGPRNFAGKLPQPPSDN